MPRYLGLLPIVLIACAPAASPPPTYGGARAATAPTAGLAVRGRIPRGTRVDQIVAVSVDQRTGKRTRIHVRPAADGSYVVQLPRGHRYALAYESQGRHAGAVTFPNAHGQPSQTINVSQNVVINNQSNQYVDLGDTNFVNGQFVAAYDPYSELDSDGDGVADAQDPDDADEAAFALEPQAFDGDFEEVEEAELTSPESP